MTLYFSRFYSAITALLAVLCRKCYAYVVSDRNATPRSAIFRDLTQSSTLLDLKNGSLSIIRSFRPSILITCILNSLRYTF